MSIRPGCSSESRTSSSRSKKKRVDQTANTVEIIRNTMEYANNQLKVIAEGPNLQRQDERASRAEVVRQLQEVPELSTRDRVRLMWKIMRNIDDMKAFLEVPNELKLDYCMGILKDNA